MGDETKRCPFCAEEILSAAVKCKHCGSNVGELPMSLHPRMRLALVPFVGLWAWTVIQFFTIAALHRSGQEQMMGPIWSISLVALASWAAPILWKRRSGDFAMALFAAAAVLISDMMAVMQTGDSSYFIGVLFGSLTVIGCVLNYRIVNPATRS